MPESEKSFGDRLQRGHSMQAAIAAMSPPFDPADDSLEVAVFNDFLDDVLTANDAVGTTVAEWETQVSDRWDLVASVESRTTQSLAYVKSNKAWAKHFPAVKRAADKVRDIKPAKPKAPAPPPPGSPAPKPPRNKGGGSFGDIALNFGKYVSALGQLAGFAPPDVDITLVQLASAKESLDALNATVAAREVDVSNAQKDRREIYDGADGLREKMVAIKAAVKGQYGQRSAEYASVKGIRL